MQTLIIGALTGITYRHRRIGNALYGRLFTATRRMACIRL